MQEKSMFRLTFNHDPGLALAGFRTTRPKCTLKRKRQQVNYE